MSKRTSIGAQSSDNMSAVDLEGIVNSCDVMRNHHGRTPKIMARV